MGLLIKGGRVITHADDYQADIYCEGETITRIEPAIDQASLRSDIEVIDASGKYVFPGFIDPHVHIYLPFMGTEAKDDWTSASKAALVGGTTTLIEMICPGPDDEPTDAFETWLQMLFSGEDTGEDSPFRRWTWHNDEIHEREHVKWANSDNVRELLEMAQQRGGPEAFEAIAGDIALHIEEHRFGILETLALQADAQAPAPSKGAPTAQGPKGAAQGLSNSNREAGTTRSVPSGSQEGAQGGEQGPV